jgi:hypothetical protein
VSEEERRALLAEIADRLTYFGEGHETEQAIVSALVSVPAEVREFALDYCRFFSIGDGLLGPYVPGMVALDPATGSTDGVWLVVLAEGLEAEDAESIVAHELAHLWLGHEVGVESGRWNETEEAACELTRSWGFTGKGSEHDVRIEDV